VLALLDIHLGPADPEERPDRAHELGRVDRLGQAGVDERLDGVHEDVVTTAAGLEEQDGNTPCVRFQRANELARARLARRRVEQDEVDVGGQVVERQGGGPDVEPGGAQRGEHGVVNVARVGHGHYDLGRSVDPQ